MSGASVLCVRGRVPEIVHAVLVCVARQRELGNLSEYACRQKLGRLRREELNPRGLVLQVVPVPGGGRRYLIIEAEGGALRDAVQFPEQS